MSHFEGCVSTDVCLSDSVVPACGSSASSGNFQILICPAAKLANRFESGEKLVMRMVEPP